MIVRVHLFLWLQLGEGKYLTLWEEENMVVFKFASMCSSLLFLCLCMREKMRGRYILKYSKKRNINSIITTPPNSHV